MPKCSPRCTPPSLHLSQPKHVKYEHSHTEAGPSQQPAPLRSAPPLGQLFSLNLQQLRSQSGDSQLTSIHLVVTTHIRVHRQELFTRKLLSSQEWFKTVVESRLEFWKIFEKAADENANDDDRDALLNHGTCLGYGINQGFTNILRCILGPSPA
jgi:hypothetical protein